MADTIQWYQRAVDDYTNRVSELESEIRGINASYTAGRSQRDALRAQARETEPGSEAQAALLFQINDLNRELSFLDAKEQDLAVSLSRAQSSLNQAQADLARVSAGATAPVPDAPTVSQADTEAAEVISRTDTAEAQRPENYEATDPAEIPGVTVFGPSLAADTGEVPGVTVDVPAAATDDPFGFDQDDFDIVENDDEDTVADDPFGFDQDELVENDEDILDDGISPFGEEDDPLDFNTVNEAEDLDDGLSPFGEEDDPFDPDTVDEAEDLDDGLSPYGEEDDPLDLDFDTVDEAEDLDDGLSPYGEEDDPLEVENVDPENDTDFGSATVDAARARAQQQAQLNIQTGAQQSTDWRVRLSLASQADYLYRQPGITEGHLLYPLSVTNGVIFPYTPQISTTYGATYSQYDLTHSNFRGYFYQNSYVDAVQIQATFTAQDTSEANYLLAVIHFFRSVTKMFYGQDPNRGVPPPLVFLTGLGEFQFNNHPCLVQNFSYNLPNDIDYIRAKVTNIVGGESLLFRRDRQSLPSNVSSAVQARLTGAQLNYGATAPRPAPPALGTQSPTYVPTKLDIQLSLLPIQTRQQVSQEFSLRDYASGDLLRRGFW